MNSNKAQYIRPLDKEQTSYDDLLDGIRLSLKGYTIK